MTLTATSVERLYHAGTTPELVVVPALRFLTIGGQGDPNTNPAYAEAVQALHAVSYAARFALRKAGGAEFKVSPLEGLWWSEDLTAFRTGHRSAWEWTAMIRQPESVTEELVHRLAEEVATSKDLAAARRLRLVSFEEGPAAQVLHIGPYAAEGPTIARLHEFLHERGLHVDGRVGKHHEIYLGDPRRTAPAKLRTIIRQPYRA